MEQSNTSCSFGEQVTVFKNRNKSLCREVNSVTFFLSLKNPIKKVLFSQILCSARLVKTVVFTTKEKRPNICRGFLNSDRIIYIDAEVVASSYAVFQLIALVGFSVDQSKDRQLACV